ncbi:MAG TPA: PEP-utilizing enzyme [Thermoleophilia bacterium]|nr:PEP-utilizing enzyme [Thermoleophilia bacterium]
MTGAESGAGAHFETPGPGSWHRDPVHFPRPVTRYFAETHPVPFATGTRDMAVYYGMLIDGLRSAYVNGFAYVMTPPAPEAEVPQRFARAEEVFSRRLWREQLRDWDENRKPASIAAHRSIQSVDPDALSDDDLIAYLRRCRDHHAAMMQQHMYFTAGAVVPVGDFLVQVGGWTDLPPSDLLTLMRGASAVSAGSSTEFERLTAAIAGDPSAQAVLQSDDDPGKVLEQLRSLPGEAGPAVSGYLDLVGWRLLDGFDISQPAALEMPDALLRSIRSSVDGGRREDVDLAERTADVRGRVPEAHRGEFDELLGEARLTYRLRDERGVYSDIWAAGLMRRAVLAAGRRLAGRGRLRRGEDLLDAGLEEMCAVLAGSPSPAAEELAARADARAAADPKSAPFELGDPPPPPPDLSGLPPTVARLMRATGVALSMVFGSSEAEHGEQVLRGLAASRGVYEGPARRVSDPAEFSRIVQGDVLVTEATTEAFNILLPLLGAIVTDSGGLLSHSAIVAREYGIPGVVGTREATARIADGARLRVDGDAGEVTLLG